MPGELHADDRDVRWHIQNDSGKKKRGTPPELRAGRDAENEAKAKARAAGGAAIERARAELPKMLAALDRKF